MHRVNLHALLQFFARIVGSRRKNGQKKGLFGENRSLKNEFCCTITPSLVININEPCHTRTRARAHTHTHTYIQTYTHTHIHTNTHTHIHTNTHAHKRACTHIHTHTRARTHTHTLGPWRYGHVYQCHIIHTQISHAALCCRVLQCVAVCGSVLQCVAVCCISVILHIHK